MSAATGKRRRAQARNRYKHMAPQDRPHYRRKPRAKAGMRAREAMAR